MESNCANRFNDDPFRVKDIVVPRSVGEDPRLLTTTLSGSGNMLTSAIEIRWRILMRSYFCASPKNLTLLFAALFFSTLCTAQTQPVHATIDASKMGAPISKYIYGQFLEESPDSPRPN